MATIDTREVKRFIRKHIGEIRGVQDVAENFGITYATLCHQWRKSAERSSLGKFIEPTRLQAAIFLHRAQPSALCKEIVYEARYQSVEMASRSCKRFTGHSIHQQFRSDSTSV